MTPLPQSRLAMLEYFTELMPYWMALTLSGVIAASLLVSFVAVSALVFIWAERKISGRIQDRLGPSRVGRFGMFQTLADGIKLLSKEDTMPKDADRFLFRFSPYLTFCASFVAFLVLPFGAGVVALDLDVGVFFLLAVLASEVFGVVLAGYASASKWSLFGGIREAAQVVSYEVPRTLGVLVPVMAAGSLNLSTIAHQQAGLWWQWYLFADPFTFLAFFVFFICAMASCKRAPFDLAEAESELVAGFHTEYSGLRWSFFFMAEYGSMFAVSGLAVLLFLGGWHTGLLPFEPTQQWGFWLGNLLNVPIFVGKCYLLVFVMMWIRWSLPRLRIDQVMMTCLKYFLPIGCVLFVGAALWPLLVPANIREIVRYVLAFAVPLLAIAWVVAALRRPMTGPPGELGGAWKGRPTPWMRVSMPEKRL